jgi:glutathione synthase/RimK-type ligase-like ATP-grasp enzyme
MRAAVTAVVAIATCSDLPDLDEEGRLLRDTLRARGVDAEPAVWNEEHQWDRFAAVVLRTTWDYFRSISEFLAWARRIGSRLINPPSMVAWNADKLYLLELARKGIPIIPTQYVRPGEDFGLPTGQYVVKPAIGAGVNDAATYDQDRIGAARAHIRALHAAGSAVLIQPYCHRVDDEAETEVVFIDGEMSHCMRKGPLLSLDRPIEKGPWREEDMTARAPEPDMVMLARRVHDLAAARFGLCPLYARVDAVRDDDGRPVLMELELVEPSLFLQYQQGSAARLAEAIARRIKSAPC